MGPAAVLLQEAGSRQLGWEAFVLREVRRDKQPLIVGLFHESSCSPSACASRKVRRMETSQAVFIELYPKGSSTVRVLLKRKAALKKNFFSKQLFVRTGNWFSKCVPRKGSIAPPGN